MTKSAQRQAARMVHAHDDGMMKVEFEFLHKRDDDLSVKAGAVLGFAGLLIASSLVILAAEPGTALHAEAASEAGLAAAVALAALFLGAVFALLAIASTRVYDLSDADALLHRLDRQVKSREASWRMACFFTFVGAVIMAASYGLVLAANAFGFQF